MRAASCHQLRGRVLVVHMLACQEEVHGSHRGLCMRACQAGNAWQGEWREIGERSRRAWAVELEVGGHIVDHALDGNQQGLGIVIAGVEHQRVCGDVPDVEHEPLHRLALLLPQNKAGCYEQESGNCEPRPIHLVRLRVLSTMRVKPVRIPQDHPALFE